MNSGPDARQLRDEALRLFRQLEKHEQYNEYKSLITTAFNSTDTDMLQIIIWFLREYRSGYFAIWTVSDWVLALRRTTGRRKVAGFFTVRAMESIEAAKKALDENAANLTSKIVQAVLLHPESGPAIEHLIRDRGITEWKHISPLLKELPADGSNALVDGAL